jgi:hypothetical protein
LSIAVWSAAVPFIFPPAAGTSKRLISSAESGRTVSACAAGSLRAERKGERGAGIKPLPRKQSKASRLASSGAPAARSGARWVDQNSMPPISA